MSLFRHLISNKSLEIVYLYIIISNRNVRIVNMYYRLFFYLNFFKKAQQFVLKQFLVTTRRNSKNRTSGKLSFVRKVGGHLIKSGIKVSSHCACRKQKEEEEVKLRKICCNLEEDYNFHYYYVLKWGFPK